MRRLVDTETVMLMAGHSDEQMTDYYTRLELDETALKLFAKKDEANRFFNQEK